MTEFKIGDRVRYLDVIPHHHQNYYSEWDTVPDLAGLEGTVLCVEDGIPLIRLDSERTRCPQTVHPDNLEKI